VSPDHDPGRPLCPSARPEWDGAVAIGVVGGTADEPRVTPLERPLPVTAELLALAEPVEPTEVFRFAAPCACSGCQHYSDDDDRCALAAKVVAMIEPATERVPACDIRPRCRWFAEQGPAACRRCPIVITNDANPRPGLRAAADPAAALPS
jgi:hypothetical protein